MGYFCFCKIINHFVFLGREGGRLFFNLIFFFFFLKGSESGCINCMLGIVIDLVIFEFALFYFLNHLIKKFTLDIFLDIQERL